MAEVLHHEPPGACYLAELEAEVLNRITDLRPRPFWFHKELVYYVRARCLRCQAAQNVELVPDIYYNPQGFNIARPLDQVIRDNEYIDGTDPEARRPELDSRTERNPSA
ncbi:hypothetical protein Dimus_000109 [Dionaea muscipula]